MTAAEQAPATERVEQIRARLDAATDGPWFQGRENDPYESVCDVYSKRSPDEPDSHDIATYIWSAEDAALIAHSRDDIPWLLNQLAEQAATIEDLGQTRAEDLNYQRGLEGRISAVQKAAETLLPFDQRNILAALGGHDLTQTPSGVRP